MNRKHTVIQYIRNKKGKPLGILVATKDDNGFSIGYSLCNNKDRFEKETGLKIAFGRADTWTLIPYDMPRAISRSLPDFIKRCKRYYRTSRSPGMETIPF
jgi:hypothetical protein